MALSAEANRELDAFAAQAQAAAILGEEPWRQARLFVDRDEVVAGETVRVAWQCPPVNMPIFLQVGAGAWEPVPGEGERQVRVGLRSEDVRLRVGPHVVGALRIRAVVPPVELRCFPQGPQCVVPGDAASCEWYARFCKSLLVSIDGLTAVAAPLSGSLRIPAILRPRSVVIEAQGFDGSRQRERLLFNPNSRKPGAAEAQILRPGASHANWQSWQSA